MTLSALAGKETVANLGAIRAKALPAAGR